MRIFNTPSTMTIQYPDNQVFSGDLNRFIVTKNTTATHIELWFTINDILYKEKLFFFTSDIIFSISDILKLIFSRTLSNIFITSATFSYTIKLYNNTSLIDSEDFSIDTVILGKRRVFDELMVIKNTGIYDYDNSIALNRIWYFFANKVNLYAVLNDGTEDFLEECIGLKQIYVPDISDLNYFMYKIPNLMKNPTFQYLGGAGSGDGENQWSLDDKPSCGSSFGINAGNDKMQLIIADVSCGNIFYSEYLGGSFVSGQSYEITIVVDEVNNPSGNDQFIQFNLGGTIGTTHTGVGTFTETLVCGESNNLILIAHMDADTGGFGSHGFGCTSIIVADNIETKILLDRECNGVGKKIGLRFLNRFGLWKYYYVILKTENIASKSGISLPFLDDNASELNNIYSEQNKSYNQSISVFREGLDKDLANDFSDIIYTDYVNLYDQVNSRWIPVKVQTNTFNLAEKENLFDVSLNLILQQNNE